MGKALGAELSPHRQFLHSRLSSPKNGKASDHGQRMNYTGDNTHSLAYSKSEEYVATDMCSVERCVCLLV